MGGVIEGGSEREIISPLDSSELAYLQTQGVQSIQHPEQGSLIGRGTGEDGARRLGHGEATAELIPEQR